jgi:hypothetical protein
VSHSALPTTALLPKRTNMLLLLLLLLLQAHL